MRSVYAAANSADAYLVKNLLEHAGIRATIRGEPLQGGLGGLPVTDLIQVCVADADTADARSVVREWQETPLPADEEDAPPPAIAALRPSGGRIVLAFLVGGALGALGALAVWAAGHRPGHEDLRDYNGDGKADEQAYFEGGRLVRVEFDRNFDGQADEFVHYRDGVVSSSRVDDDFDGRPEAITHFVRGSWQTSETDRDGDGSIDYRIDAINGVVYSQEWLDASGRVVKRVVHKDGWPVRGEIDTDGDGALDTQRRYDARGEIEGSRPIAP